MNQDRPLLIPSQQWWEGSDGHAMTAPGACRKNADRPGWGFTAAEAASAQPVSDQTVLSDGRSSVRHPDAVLIRRLAVAACVLLLVCLTGLGGSKWYAAHAYASARSACDSAELEVRSSRRRLQQAMSSVKDIDMSESSVSDPKTLEELNAAMRKGKTAIPPISCRASSQSRQMLESEASRAEGVSRRTNEVSARVEKAVRTVAASQKEKRVIDAQNGLKGLHAAACRLYMNSDGKVADNATRDALQKAAGLAGRLLKSTDAARIKEAAADLQSASDAVQASMDAKAAASQAVRKAPSPDAGMPAAPAPHTPTRPQPQPQHQVQPQRQPAPQRQNPPKSNGWSVPAPNGPDTSLPDHVPGL